MNTKELEYFLVVCREKSITKASKLLYMSPQGVSRIVKNLENELETVLMNRSSAGVELTETGRCLFERAKEIVASCDELKNELRTIEQRYTGEIDLLSAYGILRLVTPECIVQFKKEHPEISFSYREFPDLEVERRFIEKEGNVAFSLAPFLENVYHVMELCSFEIKLLVNKGHPLSRKKSVTIQDLEGQPLYIESSEFKIHHQIVNRCREAGFEPNIIFETSGFSLCHKMCKQNKGISLTVDFMSEDMSKEGLKLIPFSDGDYVWRACMLTRKKEKPSREVVLFQKHVQKWLNDIALGNINR